MTKIIALMAIYDEGPTLDWAIHSALDFVDGFEIADGAYTMYDHGSMDPDRSPEHTSKILSKWQRSCLYRGIKFNIHYPENNTFKGPTGGFNRDDKPNFLFSLVPNGDLCFIIDGDEVLMASRPLNLIRQDLCAAHPLLGMIKFLRDHGEGYYHPRIFAKTSKLHAKEYD